jgi:hypothetical protein
VLAKEKLDGSAPAGVAFMIKRDTPRFADSGGWEFTFYPQERGLRAATRTHAHCADCHRSAITGDYVFGDYASAARRKRVPSDVSARPAAKSN